MLSVYWIPQFTGYIYIPHKAWITALTYTKYLNYRLDSNTGHVWSLSIEENFYFFWPIIFLYGKRVREQSITLVICIVPIIRSYASTNFYT